MQAVTQQQQTLETLNTKLAVVQQELVRNPIKQQASLSRRTPAFLQSHFASVALWEQIRGLQGKNAQLKADLASEQAETPTQQRERLTQHVCHGVP